MANSREERPRVVLVCRCLVVNGDGRLLLLQRSGDDNHEPGVWEVPGGKLDEGQDLEVALKREVREEAGLEIEIVSPLAFTQSKIIPDGKYAGLPWVRLFYIGRPVGGGLKLSSEHQAAAWATLAELESFELTEDVPKAVSALRTQLASVGAV